MKETPYAEEFFEEGEQLNIKAMISKYLRFWPWFMISIFCCLSIGYIYLRYAPMIYSSSAKIKIIDDSKETNIGTEALSFLSGSSKINLDNEMEILKSYRLLEQVVDELDLDIAYYGIGNIKTIQIWDPPFKIIKNELFTNLDKPQTFDLQFGSSSFTITAEHGKRYVSPIPGNNQTLAGLPIDIDIPENYEGNEMKYEGYKVVINPVKQTVLDLVKNIQVSPTNKQSEILALSLQGESIERSEAILNTILNKFNKDGILDRQLVSQRTLDFIDDRFIYLTTELDSIERDKKEYKQANDLSYIEADAGLALQQRSSYEKDVFSLENQVALTNLLREILTDENAYQLMPSDIGVDNNSINSLVSNYNQRVLEREKLIASGGINNPTVQIVSGQLDRTKMNIQNTLRTYHEQLKLSLQQLSKEEKRTGVLFSNIPEKEKKLRAIERQQVIKENLFLLLLQKREEAAINLAVTSPSIKIVDYAITSNIPVSPKKAIILLGSLFLGVLIPFGILFLHFSLDTKIYDREMVEKLNPKIPVLCEIPFFNDKKTFLETNDRSILAESFRILSTNVDYLLPNKFTNEGHVIFATSSIKGEGKTLVAHNLSLAYASIKKKVLLVGADLRNPQLHTYFNTAKNTVGLSNYLYNPEMDWRECIQKGYYDNEYHSVCFSSEIPINAPVLLSGNNFEQFLNKAREEFDYVIVDTAPVMLVTDTLLISKYADATLFITRAGVTEKHLLDFAKELNAGNKLINMAHVINGVDQDTYRGYNYGYGYGYGSTDAPQSKFKKWFSK